MVLTPMQSYPWFPLPAPRVEQDHSGPVLPHNHLVGLHRESRKQQKSEWWSENCVFKPSATANPALPPALGRCPVCNRREALLRGTRVMYKSQALQ